MISALKFFEEKKYQKGVLGGDFTTLKKKVFIVELLQEVELMI